MYWHQYAALDSFIVPFRLAGLQESPDFTLVFRYILGISINFSFFSICLPDSS